MRFNTYSKSDLNISPRKRSAVKRHLRGWKFRPDIILKQYCQSVWIINFQKKTTVVKLVNSKIKNL